MGPPIPFEELKTRAEAGDENALFDLVAALDKTGRQQESLELLMRAADKGNALARLTVGVRAMMGAIPQLDRADAVRLIEASARQGCVQAAEMFSVLIGLGYAPGGLENALDMLQRAAELGSRNARGQLAILTSARGLAEAAHAGQAAPDLWARLRKAIDLQALLTAPEVTWLCDSPRVGSVPHFIGGEICDWLIARARSRLMRALVNDSDGVSGRCSNTRTNSQAPFSIVDADLTMVLLQHRIAVTTGVAFGQLGTISVLHYSPGEQFTEHHDFLDPETPNYEEIIAKVGERIATVLIYLNEDYVGGETAFPRLRINHKGQRGEAFLFFNAGADGKPDLRTEHAGRPPISGEKWIVSLFMRNRRMLPWT